MISHSDIEKRNTKFNTDEFIEQLDEFWSDLQNDKFEFNTEELQLAKRIIEQNPRAFQNDEYEK